METREIEFFLRNAKISNKHFKGVYPCNYLNNIKLKENESIIINSCSYPQTTNLCHWVLLINRRKSLFYFDSAGVASFKNNKYILNFIKKYKKKIFYNKFQIQSELSDRFGQFVCVFLVLFYKNKRIIPKLQQIFNLKTLKVNDKIVDLLFKFIKSVV